MDALNVYGGGPGDQTWDFICKCLQVYDYNVHNCLDICARPLSRSFFIENFKYPLID